MDGAPLPLNGEQVLGIADLSADPTEPFGTLGAEYAQAYSATRMNPLFYNTRQSHRGRRNAASPWQASAGRYQRYFPGRGSQLLRRSAWVKTTWRLSR
ncbi:hypothetical protein GCM10007919_16660 [Rhizobium indigoferae]|nr:hypothetical protein GCM10007919_16660 [Rhizobium indigoferae]